MANDADIIKEFLVQIGVKVDESTLSKFDGIIGTIGGTVFKLAAALTAAAIGTEQFVTKMAEPLDDLYWASQRLHSGVAQIQDYSLNIRNLGGTAEGAKGSLENLAKLLRTNPGYSGFLQTLGVNPNQGAVGVAKNLVSSLKSRGMPYFIAERYGEMFGIDESTFWAEWNAKPGALDKNTYEQAYKNAGLDSNKVASQAHDLEVQLRDVGVQTNILAVNMMTHLIPAIEAANSVILKNSPAALRGANTAQNAISSFVSGTLMHPETWGRAWGREGALRSHVLDYFKQQGWSNTQAAGIAANLMAESDFNPRKPGDSNLAYGIAQWHAPRQADFKRWAGFDIHDQRATLDKQMAFVQYELTQGKYHDVGTALHGKYSAGDAAALLSRRYEIPRNADWDAQRRAALATKIEISQKTDIHITGGPNADATAHKVAASQARVNGDLVRNLKGVVQ